MKVTSFLCGAALAGGLCAVPPPARAAWSQPASLRGCDAALSSPLIVYPSSAPAAGSGPGGLLWSGPAHCAQRAYVGLNAAGASRASMASGAIAFGARLGPNGLPGPGRELGDEAGGLATLTAATGTTAGQVLAAGARAVAAPATAEAAPGAFVEGRAPGAFSAPATLAGAARPVAAFSGYLGDALLVSTTRLSGGRWALAIRVQRHYAKAPSRPRLLALSGPPTALTATMDYRSDILLVWATRGELYAREITNTGVLQPLQRLASAPPGAGGRAWRPEVRALLSDDGRGIVVWRSQQQAAGGGAASDRDESGGSGPGAARGGRAAASTTIEASISGQQLSFAAPPTRVESYRDPADLQPPAGSLSLIRMSSEAVMLAWTGVQSGRYVVRASPVSLHRGIWAPVTVSPASTAEALLAELVPGPRAEVLALWSTAPLQPDGALDGARRALFAAWGHYAAHGEAVFASAEALAVPGANGPPTAAFDPQNDCALAAWRTQTGGTWRIVYSQRTPGPPAGIALAAAPAHAAHGHSDDGRLALPALGLLLLAAAAAYRGIGRRRGWIGARR